MFVWAHFVLVLRVGVSLMDRRRVGSLEKPCNRVNKEDSMVESQQQLICRSLRA